MMRFGKWQCIAGNDDCNSNKIKFRRNDLYCNHLVSTYGKGYEWVGIAPMGLWEVIMVYFVTIVSLLWSLLYGFW